MAYATGPQVVDVTPSPGSYDIDTNAKVTVLFGSLMNGSTVTNSEYVYVVWVGDSTQSKVSGTITYSALAKTATFTPDNPFDYGKTYQVVIKGADKGGGVKDLQDSQMLKTYTSTFTVKAEQIIEEPEQDTGGEEIPVGGGEVVETPTELYVVSSYPRNEQYNISPSEIRIKLSGQSVNPLTLGTSDTLGDINIVEGELTEQDLRDISIIPLAHIDGTLTTSDDVVKFIPTKPFENDKVYTIITAGQIKQKTIKFQSKFSAFFGDITLIKGDLSRYIKISDWLLARYIADYSKIAKETATGTYGNAIDWANPPYYMDQYVRYKTQFELVSLKYVEITTSSSLMTLGDFTVQNTVSPTGLKSFLEALKPNVKRWEDALNGRFRRGYARPVAASKKENGEAGEGYPDFMDRRFKDIDGTKTS